MRFMFDYARLPARADLCEDIDSAAGRLQTRLRALDLQALDVSDYTKRYFGKYLKHLTTGLQLHCYLLALALARTPEPTERSVLIDYGGGSGLLSLIAKELGAGMVVYTDIYDVSCHDARALARALGIEADHYVLGDLPDVIAYLQQGGLAATAIASYDVIEHVYDIDAFFEELSRISSGALTVVMASGANGANPFIRRRLVRTHKELEYRDRREEWGHKQRDTLRSYSSIRREMIRARLHDRGHRPGASELDLLTANTRGMRESDIHRAVDGYVETGAYPAVPNHPSNTCDPYTGNWGEHIMDPQHLAGILRRAGFAAEVLSGFYGRSTRRHRRYLGRVLNLGIRALGPDGLPIAKFFTIYAHRS
jgi:hypothetical protein